MACKVARYLAFFIVVAVSGTIVTGIPGAGLTAEDHLQTDQEARLMQQADHQRRLSQQGRVVAEGGGIEAAEAEESSQASLDLVVMGLMAASGLAFIIASRMRRASLKQCGGRRRTRPDYPSRN